MLPTSLKITCDCAFGKRMLMAFSTGILWCRIIYIYIYAHTISKGHIKSDRKID